MPDFSFNLPIYDSHNGFRESEKYREVMATLCFSLPSPFKFHFIRLFKIITGYRHNCPSIHEGELYVGEQRDYKGAVKHNGRKHKTAVDHWEVVTANRQCWQGLVKEEVAQRQGDKGTFHEVNLLSSKQQETGPVN